MRLFCTLSVKTLCCGIVLALSCNAIADALPGHSIAPETLAAAREALKGFNETPPFLTTRTDREERAQTLENECYMVRPECFTYLRHNRVHALQALPDNPLYWQNLLSFLATRPTGLDRDAQGVRATQNPRYDLTRLLKAFQNWPLRELLLHGEIDAGRLAEMVGHLRRLRAQSATLYERVLYIAGHGILLSWVPVSMAAAADRFDDDGLAALHRELTPLSVQERRYDQIFVNESALVGSASASMPTIDEYRAQYGDISGYEYEQQMRFAAAYVEFFPQMGELIARLSELDEISFWQEGPQWPPEDVGMPQEAFEYVDTWKYHVAMEMAFNVSVRVYQALGEIYGGLVSPGLPARPAPIPWRWNWEVDTRTLCLEGVDLHPQALSLTHNEKYCYRYYDAAAVRITRP